MADVAALDGHDIRITTIVLMSPLCRSLGWPGAFPLAGGGDLAV